MQEEQLRQYWRRELRWGSGPHSRLSFEFVLGAADFVGTGTVLDAGAGHQRYKPFFTRAVYLTQEHPAGVEFKKMQGLEYDFLAPLDERIPLRDDSLDAVLNTSVLEHVRYPERFLAEAHRVLKPGGRLYIHVPFAHPEHEIPFDFQRPTRYGLRAWLESAGFKQIDVRPGSSATATATSFMRSAFAQDALGERTPDFKRSPMSALLQWARSEPIAMLHRLSLLALALPSILWLELVGRGLDRGPHSATVFPVGWMCIATKEGERVPTTWDRAQFLREQRRD